MLKKDIGYLFLRGLFYAPGEECGHAPAQAADAGLGEASRHRLPHNPIGGGKLVKKKTPAVFFTGMERQCT